MCSHDAKVSHALWLLRRVAASSSSRRWNELHEQARLVRENKTRRILCPTDFVFIPAGVCMKLYDEDSTHALKPLWRVAVSSLRRRWNELVEEFVSSFFTGGTSKRTARDRRIDEFFVR